MNQVNSGTAYLLWCLWLFGLGGIQRLYAGSVGIGLIYLFTWGLFGVGQVLDLALIPGMVEKRNIYLRGLQGNKGFNVTPQVTLNITDIEQLKHLKEAQLASGAAISPMQKLLRAAKEHGGQLSIAQAALYTELEPTQLRELLQEALRAGYADVNNDPKTGAVRYHFDI